MNRAQEVHRKILSAILERTCQLGYLDAEYNIIIHNQEVRCKDMYCICLAQDRERCQDLVNPVRIKFLTKKRDRDFAKGSD
jgi:hypothetical protein